MELWNHCENPYPFVPAEVLDAAPAVRASLPNKYCEPEIAAGLYDEVFDEYQLCDDIGLNIVTNEHHSGINNLWAASPIITGIVARLTKKVRILSLGTLITVRPDPVRVATEYATIDVISRGRLDIGFVKSGATEMVSGDANPMRIREREWEAIDLIEKSLTSHEGPFSWEGKFFTHAHVNICLLYTSSRLTTLSGLFGDRPFVPLFLGRTSSVNMAAQRPCLLYTSRCV